MGLMSWRGKTAPEEVITETASATGADLDAANDLRNFKKHHKWDPFLDIDRLDAVDGAVASGDVEGSCAWRVASRGGLPVLRSQGIGKTSSKLGIWSQALVT